ncbi:MAG TPA: hypothetical protein VHG29_12600 [Novosphingobium sp.]|nr:hypothetical protein [Novosphingobium sp.]
MTRFQRILILAAIPLALTACKGEQKANGKTAGGEILPGSTSDAMLPLDTVRSQPPLAPRTEAASKPGKGKASDGAADSGADAAGPQPTNSATTVPAPVAPTPEE